MAQALEAMLDQEPTSRDQQLVEAAIVKYCPMSWVNKDEIQQIIASVPRPEPVAWMRTDPDGFDSAFRDHRTIVSCTGNPWTDFIPLYTSPMASKEAVSAEPVNAKLLEALKTLYRGYVALLEGGRDRIIDLGCDCDSVEQMEYSNPMLKQIREQIAQAEGVKK